MAGFLETLNQLLKSPSQKGLFFVGIIVILSLVAFGSLIFWNNQPDYQVLFSNLSQEDAGEIMTKLKEKKIPYQVSPNGSTIMVPRDQVYDIRLGMASEGLPKGGGVGFEVFDRINLGATDFVQKLNYQRAMQGELSRTIRQIKEIEQARVHIVTPKDSLFVEEQRKPTASVLIKTRSGMTLGNSQVEGIVHLVASAIEGLDPSNITVIDTSGKILSKRSDTSPIGQLTTSQLEYQRNIEEGLKKKIQGMLEGVLGANKAIARVATEIDFQEVNIIEETYDPKSVIRSEQRGVEKSTTQSGGASLKESKGEAQADRKAPRGKTGSASGTPSGPTNASTAERQNEVRNYEISKINKQIRNPVGSIKKVSAAVIVDGTYKEVAGTKGTKGKQYAPRPAEEMKNLETIVRRAIGYDEKRGDQVEVMNMPFSLSPMEEEVQGAKGFMWKEYLLMFYKPLVSLLLALLFIFFVIKPLFKRWAALPAKSEAPMLPEGEQPLPRGGSQLAGVKRPLELRDQTIQLAKEDPTKAAGVLKSWLHERE